LEALNGVTLTQGAITQEARRRTTSIAVSARRLLWYTEEKMRLKFLSSG